MLSSATSCARSWAPRPQGDRAFRGLSHADTLSSGRPKMEVPRPARCDCLATAKVPDGQGLRGECGVGARSLGPTPRDRRRAIALTNTRRRARMQPFCARLGANADSSNEPKRLMGRLSPTALARRTVAPGWQPSRPTSRPLSAGHLVVQVFGKRVWPFEFERRSDNSWQIWPSPVPKTWPPACSLGWSASSPPLASRCCGISGVSPASRS